jgi:hypothetical protein
VDFQGLYSSMPDPIKIPTTASPFFVTSDKVEQADFSMIGWRAIEAPLKLSKMKGTFRRKMDQQIPRKPSPGTESYYDANNVLVWDPSTYVISAAGADAGQLSILNRITD